MLGYILFTQNDSNREILQMSNLDEFSGTYSQVSVGRTGAHG